ncbi:MAG: T9SS type A sorting domain-containing protein [Bacteroidia bacterium]
MKILKNIMFCAILLFGCKASWCQQITFADTLVGYYPGENYSGAIEELSDSGFFFCIQTAPVGLGAPSYLVYRINKYGDTTWSKSYLNTANIYRFAKYNDTSFIVPGRWFFNTTDPKIQYALVNLQGDTLWVKKTGTTLSVATVFKAVKGLNHEFLILGNYAYDYGYLKIDSNGNELWHKYNNMYWGVNDAALDFDGGFVTCGGDDAAKPYVFVRLDSNGNELWHRNYGHNPCIGNCYFAALCVAQTSDSNYLFGVMGNGVQLYKIRRSNGGKIWSKDYFNWNWNGTNVYHQINGIVNLGNDTFVCTTEKFYMAIDENGDTLWTKPYPFNSTSINNFIVKKTSDNGLIFFGYFGRPPTQGSVVCYFKTDINGNIQTTGILDVISPSGNLEVYPNPATDKLYINAGTMINEKKLVFSLTDLQGRSVLNGQYEASTPIDVSALPGGIYIATLKGKEKEVRGKVIIQR